MDGGFDDSFLFYLVQGLEAANPLAVAGLVNQVRQSRQRGLAVGHHGDIGFYILINLGKVNVEVDDLRLRGIGLNGTCHAAAEAHADSND